MTWLMSFAGPCDCHPLPEFLDTELLESRFVRLWLWVSSTGLWDELGQDVAVDELAISGDLQRDIARWAADYDDVGNGMLPMIDHLAEAHPAFPLDWFNRRGELLKARLEAELGDEWVVEHRRLWRKSS
ncbi:hypothetical protein WG908_15735 [Sphingobium sp. AN641]|uniref:hypothetical protein n=1 Tax=Sphingobium sp. AN641 TaxID=3133443 RepID=UPI0030BAE729